MTLRPLKRLAASALAAVLVAGCAADGSGLTETGAGAAIGTAGGAAAGAIIGSLSANAGRGALIGAVGGALDRNRRRGLYGKPTQGLREGARR
jgi:hypothetical protein